ncbi:hypothetical protein F2Q69_00012480 [Brassica cretica]|uniref:Endonuclease/exonuclease/phosphatase domain-containing protein n=1 Tax=Brassica cretica TaxID=69181 RepID=A0A8S9R6P3_BRACR|nr:hypothetical protein F2Q69_00012480 [Brassica cretica]
MDRGRLKKQKEKLSRKKSLAHERPACPLLRNKDRKAPPLPLPTGLSAFSKEQQLLLVVSSAPSSSVSPGFEPLFPKLPPEERRMALQYISHSDPAERQARILRVQQSAPVSAMDSLPKIPKISTNIDKGKGHVFGYEGQSSIVPNMQNKAISVCNSSPPIFSRNANDLSDISDHEVSSSLSPIGLTVFRVGSSSGVPLYGTRIDVVAKRKVVWDHLAAMAVTRDEVWLLTGDFNELLSNDDKLGGSIRSEDVLLERIARCRRELSKWKRSTKLNSRDRIQRLTDSLEAEIAKVDPDAETMWTLRKDLTLAYRDEELFWRQLNREEWLFYLCYFFSFVLFLLVF